MELSANLLLEDLSNTKLFSKPYSLIPLKGGVVNKNYKFICGKSQYFLKCFEQDHLIPTKRREVYLLQAQLALLGIAPLPIYLSDKQDLQVEQWVEGLNLADSTLSRKEQIIELARALYQIHKLEITAKVLDLPGIWQGYMDSVKPAETSLLFEKIARCEQIWLDSCQQEQVLCHNDLAMGHVMLGQASLVLDWEYAAIGNRYFDLASCATINKFDLSDTLLLQQSYSEQAGLALQELQQQMKMQYQLVELTNQLWYWAAGIDKA